MYKLLKINGVDLPNPEGDFTIKKNDKYNEYETEDGSVTVESIRQGILSLSVSYKGLIESDLKKVTESIKLVSDVEIYDPMMGSIQTIKAKITNVRSRKSYYRHDVSVWTLDFELDQL